MLTGYTKPRKEPKPAFWPQKREKGQSQNAKSIQTMSKKATNLESFQPRRKGPDGLSESPR